MKKSFAFLPMLAFITSAFAQKTDSLFCTVKQIYLYQKAEASPKSKVLDTIRFTDKVLPLDKFGDDAAMKKQKLKPVSVDNISGYWLRVQNGKQKGYVFSGAFTNKAPNTAKDDILVLSLENEAAFNTFFYRNLKDYHLYTLENKGNMITMNLRKITALQYNTTLSGNTKPLLTNNPTTKNVSDSVVCIFALNKKKYKWDAGKLYGACPAKFAAQPQISFQIDAENAPSRLQIDLPTTDWRLRLELEPLGKPKNPNVKAWKLWYERRDGKQKELLQASDISQKDAPPPTIFLDFFGDLDHDNKLDLLLRLRENGKVTRKLYLSSFALKTSLKTSLLREMASNEAE
ncbi:MAG: hypothetical protein RI894_539 [Bacteroidota bacterium]|jgi:hypothetical protein